MNYKNDTFLFLLQEVSLKYHKIASKYRKRLRVYTIVVFSFVRTFAPSF